MTVLSPLMNVMQAAAHAAARRLKRDFGELEHLQVSRKGPGDFVSAADRRADEILREHLGQARPGYGFLTEESGEIAGSDTTHRWIIDPLDGTHNFLHAIPYFAISIALEREGELVAGLVYSPIQEELFYAERGEGAFVNRRRLRVSARTELADAMLACGLPRISQPATRRLVADAQAVGARCSGLRRMGAAALDLAWTAAGRFDGYWDAELRLWDIAAGIVLLREAGGIVSDRAGREAGLQRGEIVAGNGSIQPALLEVLGTSSA